MEDGKSLRERLAPHWWDLSPWEVKIFITIFWFADPGTGELTISLYSLSQKVNSRTKDMLPWLEKLKLRGLIDFDPGSNPLLESCFKIWPGKLPPSVPFDDQNSEEIAYLPLDPEEESHPVTGNDTVTGTTGLLKVTFRPVTVPER